LSKTLNVQFYMRRRGAVTKRKTRLEQCHKNLLNKWMVNCQILETHRVQWKLAITRLGHCVVRVTTVHPGQWWGQKAGIAEISGEELELARGRPAVPKTYLRFLINLKKIFSLTHGEIWRKGGKNLKVNKKKSNDPWIFTAYFWGAKYFPK